MNIDNLKKEIIKNIETNKKMLAESNSLSIRADSEGRISAYEVVLELIEKKDPETKQIQKFEIGKKYKTESLCDCECIFRFEVIGRTEKTVTLKMRNEMFTRRIKIYEGKESVMPFGNYSMACYLDANDIDAE